MASASTPVFDVHMSAHAPASNSSTLSWPAYVETFKWSRDLPLSDPFYPFAACAVYLVVVYGLQAWMKNREPFRLKRFALVHNFFLSILSFVMLLGILIPFNQLMQRQGFTSVSQAVNTMLCDAGGITYHGPTYFWLYIFYLSKYYEFLDTVFLVLRKKPVIFLHVYHHPMTLVLMYYCLDERVAPTWLNSAANAVVHTVMYYYYALQILGIKVWWKRYITNLQIAQFVVDTGANVVATYLMYVYAGVPGRACSGTMFGNLLGCAVILSYLLLFVKFYLDTYKRKGASTSKKSRAVKQD